MCDKITGLIIKDEVYKGVRKKTRIILFILAIAIPSLIIYSNALLYDSFGSYLQSEWNILLETPLLFGAIILFFLFNILYPVLHETIHYIVAVITLKKWRGIKLYLNICNNFYCYIPYKMDSTRFRIIAISPFIVDVIILSIFCIQGTNFIIIQLFFSALFLGAFSDFNMFFKSYKYKGAYFKLIEKESGKVEVYEFIRKC